MIKGGPKIVNDGLILCLDAHDAKSYAGEPVTNLYGDMSTSSSLRGNRTEYNTGGTWPSDMPMCPEPVGRVYKHTSGALTSSWSGNSYGYMHKDISTTSGLMYTLTCWVYLSPDCDIDYMFASIEGATSNYGAWTGYPNGYDFTKKGTWQLLSRHATADTSVRFLIYPGHTGVTDGSFSGFFAWGGMQVVQAEHVTPFILSSRSATNGWVDRSGNSNSGTLTNMIGTDASHYRDGQVIMPVANSYLEFDGSNDYIDGPTIAPNIGAFTYEAVIYRTSSDFLAVGTGTALGGGTYMQIFVYDAGMRVNLYAPQGIGGGWRTGSTIPNTSNTFVNNNIYHVTVVNDGTVFYFYKNGVSLGSYDHSYLSNTSSTRLGILRNHVQSVGGTGRVYLARMYDKALTAAEVLQNYNATKGRFS